MFPEITRDEVFRIETPRLWLRWPFAADADALAAIMARQCRSGGATVAHVNAEAVRGLIATWRADMEAGRALHFVPTLKTGDREPLGVIHTGAERSCFAAEQRALGDEAAVALRRMTALLGMPLPRPTPPMAQQPVFPAPTALAARCLQA